MIYLDGGHGWDTDGKQAPDFDGDGWSDMKENEFNDSIISKVSFALDLMKIPYLVTSMDWRDVPLSERVSLANNHWRDWSQGMAGEDALFMSVHADAFEHSSQANGSTVFYYEKDGRFSTKSKEIAELFSSMISEGSPISSRGVRGKNFHVLRETTMSAILIESGFMTNPRDLSFLTDEIHRNFLARKIAEACYLWNGQSAGWLTNNIFAME